MKKIFLKILLLSLPKMSPKSFLELWFLSLLKILPKCFLKILLLSSYSSSSLLSLSLTMALSSAGRQILSAGDDDPSIADINVSIIIVIMTVTITVIVTVIAMVIATVWKKTYILFEWSRLVCGKHLFEILQMLTIWLATAHKSRGRQHQYIVDLPHL